MSGPYKIREICGDWALDIEYGEETHTIFFNSRNNAELVKAILEHEKRHPNEAVPYIDKVVERVTEERRKALEAVAKNTAIEAWNNRKPIEDVIEQLSDVADGANDKIDSEDTIDSGNMESPRKIKNSICLFEWIDYAIFIPVWVYFLYILFKLYPITLSDFLLL